MMGQGQMHLSQGKQQLISGTAKVFCGLWRGWVSTGAGLEAGTVLNQRETPDL